MRFVDVLGAAARGGRELGAARLVAGVRDVADRPLLRLGRPVLAADVAGLRVRGFLRHRSFLADIMSWGSAHWNAFVNLVRPGTVVVDGGAHIGVYALLAAARNQGASVLAVEPDPYNLRALDYNVTRSGARNVRVVPKALAERPRTATLFQSAGTIAGSLFERESGDAETTVEVTSVDEELRGLELESLLVKLNVEGAEQLAIDGMHETLARCDDVTLVVALHPPILTRPEELVGALRERGFSVHAMAHEGSLTEIPPGAAPGKTHVLARRPSRSRTDR